MSDRRFALVDFTYRGKTGCLRLYEAGCTYALPPAVAHAATKRPLVARQRPPHWTPPSIFRPTEVLTEVEVIETDAELKALQRHALGVVDQRQSSSAYTHRGATGPSPAEFTER
jgi:hypothetical protein